MSFYKILHARNRKIDRAVTESAPSAALTISPCVEPSRRAARLPINHVVTALKGTAMTVFRAIAFAGFAALVIAAVTGPAGSSATASCGGAIMQIRDPGLRASFEKFEAQQSGTAAKICATFLNAG